MRIIGVIPARFKSSRLEGNPLADIHGEPMIRLVYDCARKARVLDDVLVATDDDRILKAVESFGGTAVLTSPDHASGTDRVAEAVDFHETVPAGVKLDEVFSLEQERTVSRDWVVRHQNRHLQIEAAQVQPGAKVTMRTYRNGRVEMLHEGKRLSWHVYDAAARRPEPRRHKRRRASQRQPAADHPWRRMAVVA